VNVLPLGDFVMNHAIAKTAQILQIKQMRLKRPERPSEREILRHSNLKYIIKDHTTCSKNRV